MTVHGTVDRVTDTASADVFLATEECGGGTLQQMRSAQGSASIVTASSACMPMSEAPWSGGTRTDSLCSDERDEIIAQYYDTTYFKPQSNQPGANWKPTCASFTQADSTKYFKHAELRKTNPHTWTILQSSLLAPDSLGYGLDRWRIEYGASRIINSGYRPPKHNRKEGGVRGSRHMFGDAVDLRNESGTEAEWLLMVDAARRANAGYIEPRELPCKLNCTHADWRFHTLH